MQFADSVVRFDLEPTSSQPTPDADLEPPSSQPTPDEMVFSATAVGGDKNHDWGSSVAKGAAIQSIDKPIANITTVEAVASLADESQREHRWSSRSPGSTPGSSPGANSIWSLTDRHFFEIVFNPDGIPIELLVFLLSYYSC